MRWTPTKGELVKRIVILTGSELRHVFCRYIALSEDINSSCEGQEKSLRAIA